MRRTATKLGAGVAGTGYDQGMAKFWGILLQGYTCSRSYAYNFNKFKLCNTREKRHLAL